MPIPAASNDPWIGVHVLTEFIFCPRAGLIEFEQRSDDEGEDHDDEQRDPSRLDYSPSAHYELHIIERDLKLLIDKARGVLPACHGIAAAIALSDLILVAFWGFSWLFAMPIVVCAYVPALANWRPILSLVRQRTAALNATPAEPDPESKQNQQVNWWRLFKAGFESVAYKDALRFEPWRLAGRPWRVLRRGSLRIPVFRKRHCDGPKGQELRRQHYARIAAYCLLLEKAEGAESPYGIVLFGNGHDGVAIPAGSAGSWKPLRDGLELARRVILEAEQGRDPAEPDSGNPCKGCHLGKPYVHRPGQTEHSRFGRQLPVSNATGIDKRPYHSACGDRFRWVPPHAKAIQLRIV